MVIKKWKSKELKERFPNCESLSGVLKELSSLAWKDKSVICEIQLNGEFLSEEDEVKKGALPVHEIDELQVSTQTTDQLLKSSVQSYIRFIPQIKKAAIDCSEDFREQKAEGSGRFTDVLDGCRWMTDALYLLKSNMQKWDAFLELGPEWSVMEKKYSSTVNEIVRAYESNDTQLLADVLEYELSNSLDGWVQVFEKIESRMDI